MTIRTETVTAAADGTFTLIADDFPVGVAYRDWPARTYSIQLLGKDASGDPDAPTGTVTFKGSRHPDYPVGDIEDGEVDLSAMADGTALHTIRGEVFAKLVAVVASLEADHSVDIVVRVSAG